MTESESRSVTHTLINISLNHRDRIRDVLTEIVTARSEADAGPIERLNADPDVEADMLYLMIRGFYLLSVENPDAWTDERIFEVMNYTLDLVT